MSFLDNLSVPNPFSRQDENVEYFFALIISTSDITSALWTIERHKLRILNQSTIPYSTNDQLLEKGSLALDNALMDLPVEPKKLLIGVPSHWTHDDNLKEEYLKLLTRMIKEYQLHPLAYVTSTHALNYYLQKKEGIAPTAIFLGIGGEVEVSVVRAGKIVGSRTSSRSDHLYSDVEKNLAQFSEVEILPSKIVLYPTKEGENIHKVQQELMSYPWMSKLPFLHFPKIETFGADTLLKSVVFAGAYEVDPDLDIKHSLNLIDAKSEVKDQSHVHRLNEEKSFGFVSGDIKESSLQEIEPDEFIEEVPIHHQQPGAPHPHPQKNSKLGSLIGSVTSLIPFSKGAAGPPGFPRRGVPNIKLLAAPLILLLLLGAWLFLIKAEVTILVDPKIIQNSTTVTADPKLTEIDEAGKVIPAAAEEVTVTGSDKASTTGQKAIGNPAKGQVVVYNLTANKVSLNSGTVLTANNLNFTLDSAVQIASQSSQTAPDFKTVITPGKSDAVGLTAAVIGPDGNLSAGTDLTVAGFNKTQVVARVDEALSGGTSKSVNVVTSDDQKKLQAKVVDLLKQKAIEEIQTKLEEDQKIIPEALAVVDGKYSFSKKVNDQASEFSLDATVKFKGTSYKQSDLKTIVAKLVSTDIPDGFQLNLQESETTSEVMKVESDGKLIFAAKFIAKLLPKYDDNNIKSRIRGKSVSGAVEELKKLENVVGVEVEFTPKIPAFLARIPLLSNNISIIVSPK